MTHAGIIHADALAVPLRAESVDLVVTSPPYFAARSYKSGEEHYPNQVGAELTADAFLDALWAFTREAMRVLKPSGSLFVNLGDKYANRSNPNGVSGGRTVYNQRAEAARDKRDKPEFGVVRNKSLMLLPARYAIGCIDHLGLILRSEIIWSKPNGMPESVTDRVRRSHEVWLHFTKAPHYYAQVDELPGTRLAGSVWTIATEPLRVPDWLDVDHFAAFPQEFPRRIILAWCPPGGVVLDPFMGTGTTVMVAKALGRYGIGLDLSTDYLRLARWRVFRSGQGHKSERRTHLERQGVLELEP